MVKIREKINATFLNFWQDIANSTPLSEEEKQLRIVFLLRLLPLLVPIVVIAFAIQIVAMQTITLRSILIYSMAFATLLTVYLAARTRRYEFTIVTLYLVGTGVILFNAALSDPPYLELIYLFILPFVTALLLSLRETIFWIVFTFAAFTAFNFLIVLPVSREIFVTLMQVALIFNMFILFAGYQRSLLEKDSHRLEIEMNRSELLTFMINSISHDIRTPLSIINSNTYLLKRSLDDETQLERIQKIVKQTTHLDDMLRNIFTMSKIEQENIASHNPNNPEHVVRETITGLKPLFDEKQLKLVTEIETDISMVRANHDALRRIVTNLLDNAIKFTGVEGVITVRLTKSQKRVCFEVEDTGIGIPAEYLEKIFTPFFRVDEARSIYGNGMGLALVKKTVETLNATITVQSQPGEGSTFRVSFPAVS